MNNYYEQVCRKEGMNPEELKKIRRIFDQDRKALKRKNRVLDKGGIAIVSIEDLAEFDEIRNIPDENCNVEEDAIMAVEMEKLRDCLDVLPADEREMILAMYDPQMSFERYAEEKGIPRTTARRRAQEIVEKLREMMGVK